MSMSSSSKFIIIQLYSVIIQKHKLYKDIIILLLAQPESSRKHKNLLIYAAAEKLKQLKWLKIAHLPLLFIPDCWRINRGYSHRCSYSWFRRRHHRCCCCCCRSNWNRWSSSWWWTNWLRMLYKVPT